MLILFKILTTTILVIYVQYILSVPKLRDVLLAEFYLLGLPLTLLAIVLLFVGVGIYCRSLQHCLGLLEEKNRAIAPKAVWYMFLIPFNFVEDFFIVHQLSNSIQTEAKINPKLQHLTSFGAKTGLSWCIFQILCFVPNEIGKVSALLTLILWFSHWNFITKINRLLTQPTSVPQ
jgi:hypothetical protein